MGSKDRGASTPALSRREQWGWQHCCSLVQYLGWPIPPPSSGSRFREMPLDLLSVMGTPPLSQQALIQCDFFVVDSHEAWNPRQFAPVVVWGGRGQESGWRHQLVVEAQAQGASGQECMTSLGR